MQNKIPDGAIARLVMVNGNLVSLAEIAQVLETYDYEQDLLNSDRWNLQTDNQTDADAALHVLQDGEIIDVYSESPENMLNVNYIAMRIGWADCELHAINPNIEHMLLGRLANMNVIQSGTETGTSTLPPPFEMPNDVDLPADFTIDDIPDMQSLDSLSSLDTSVDDPIEGLDDDEFAQIQHLTLKLSESEQRVAQLEEECMQSQEQIRLLQQTVKSLEVAGSTTQPPPPSHTPPAGTTSDDSALLPLIERHLGTLLDLTTVTGSALAKDLLSLGYAVQVKLVKG